MTKTERQRIADRDHIDYTGVEQAFYPLPARSVGEAYNSAELAVRRSAIGLKNPNQLAVDVIYRNHAAHWTEPALGSGATRALGSYSTLCQTINDAALSTSGSAM